jgi:cell division transport system permease protein
MTVAPPLGRPGPLLAPGAGWTVAPYLTVVALSFAASLVLIATLAAGRGAVDLRERLVGSATVVVRAAGLESPDAAAARAAERLDAMAGVARAWPLEAAGPDPLIARLVDGKSNGGAPRLIAVQFKAGAAPSAVSLSRALQADGLDAGVDDHRPMTSPLMRAAGLAGLTAAALLAVIMAALGIVAAFATHRRIAGQRELVDLLGLAGATDGFIGSLFAAGAARGAAWAGVAGAVAAALAVAAWRLAGPADEAIGGEGLAFAWTNLAAAAPWPLIAAAVGALAARLAVRVGSRGAP